MAINLTKVLTQIQNRISDSATSALDLTKLIAAANRINNSGTQVLTYQSTGQLPSLADSNYVGVIARVTSDNVFGDSDGRYYYASGTDSGWRGFKTTQDSADALIEAPASGGGAPPATQVQGTAYGFKAGGEPPSNYPVIDRYSFTSDGNASDYGDLSVGRGSGFAACSEDGNYGYSAGGYGPTTSNVIDRFPYASAGNAADVGDLSRARYGVVGCSSTTNGYALGGLPGTPEVVDRFPFAASANASDIGDITGFNPGAVSTMGSASSSTTAYIMGGNPYRNMIEKMPFASDGSTTDAGADLLNNSYLGTGNNSDTHGYHSGGYIQPTGGAVNVIQKFPFAVEDNATDVGDMTSVRVGQGGSSSDTHGYVHGGSAPGPVNNIEKYSHISDGNATDVGDLSKTAWYSAQGGQQV